MENPNTSILRQRIRSPPANIKLASGCEQDLYFGDETYEDHGKGKAPYVPHEDVSSYSHYESGSELDDESTEGISVVGEGVNMNGKASTSTPAPSKPENNSYPNGQVPAESPPSSKSWNEFDLSVVVALVSPIGNWLTGDDHVKNLLLILFLIFYLHQIIEIPWSLYQQARPRRRPQPISTDASTEDKYHNIAISELRQIEFMFLGLTVVSPLLGVLLLRAVISISWFSTCLFVLATGIRPWRHIVERIRQRTMDLHTVIHYPPAINQATQAEVNDLLGRLAAMEEKFINTDANVKNLKDDLDDQVDEAVEVMEKTTRRQDRKWETVRTSQEAQLAKLEQNVEILLERMEVDVSGTHVSKASKGTTALVSALVDQMSPVLPAFMLPYLPKEKSQAAPRSPKTPRSRHGPKLETIPEGSVFDSKPSKQHQSSVYIPGLGLVLRIGDLATLPVRTVVRYLLSGRVYTPRRPLSSQ